MHSSNRKMLLQRHRERCNEITLRATAMIANVLVRIQCLGYWEALQKSVTLFLRGPWRFENPKLQLHEVLVEEQKERFRQPSTKQTMVRSAVEDLIGRKFITLSYWQTQVFIENECFGVSCVWSTQSQRLGAKYTGQKMNPSIAPKNKRCGRFN